MNLERKIEINNMIREIDKTLVHLTTSNPTTESRTNEFKLNNYKRILAGYLTQILEDEAATLITQIVQEEAE